MAEKTPSGTSSIVFGSITICCSSCSLLYVLYVLIAFGSAISGILGGFLAGISLDNVLMIVASSLAITAAKQVVNKSLWVAAVVISALSSALYLTAIVLLMVWGEQKLHQNPFTGYKIVGVVINLCIQVGLLISVSVGLYAVESEKRKRQELQQTSLEAQVPQMMPPSYSQQQQRPQVEAPPRYDDKAMLVA